MSNPVVPSSSLRNTEAPEVQSLECLIAVLPAELIQRIMAHLGFRETVAAAGVCRAWRRLTLGDPQLPWGGAEEPEVRAALGARRVELCVLVGGWEGSDPNLDQPFSIAWVNALVREADGMMGRVRGGRKNVSYYVLIASSETIDTRPDQLSSKHYLKELLAEEQHLHFFGLPSQCTRAQATQLLEWMIEWRFSRYAIAFMKLPTFQPTDRQLLCILNNRAPDFFQGLSSKVTWLTALPPHVVSFYLTWRTAPSETVAFNLYYLQRQTGLRPTLAWLNGFATDVLSVRFCPDTKIPETIPEDVQASRSWYRRPRCQYVEILESEEQGGPAMRPLIRASLEARDNAFRVFGGTYLDIAMRIYDQELCAALLEAGVTVRSWTLEEAGFTDNLVCPLLAAAWDRQQRAELESLPPREDRGLFSDCIRREDEQGCRLLIKAGYPVRFEDLEEAENEGSRLLPLLQQVKERQIAEGQAALRVREEQVIASFTDQGDAAPSLSTYIYQDFSIETIEHLRRLGFVYDEEALVAALILGREGDFPYAVDTRHPLSAEAFQHLLYYRGSVGVGTIAEEEPVLNAANQARLETIRLPAEEVQALMHGDYARMAAGRFVPMAVQEAIMKTAQRLLEVGFSSDGMSEFLFGRQAKERKAERVVASLIEYLRNRGLKPRLAWIRGLEAFVGTSPPAPSAIPEEVMETRFPCPLRARWKNLGPDMGALREVERIILKGTPLERAHILAVGHPTYRLAPLIADHYLDRLGITPIDLIEFGFVYDGEAFIEALIRGKEQLGSENKVDCAVPLPEGCIAKLLCRKGRGKAAKAILVLQQLISKGIRVTPAWLEELRLIPEYAAIDGDEPRWTAGEIAKVRNWILAQLNPGSSSGKDPCSIQ